MEVGGAKRPGRPAGATSDDVLEVAVRRFLAGERVDIRSIAEELSVSRGSVHRWFGTRDDLLSEVLATLTEQRMAALRAETPGKGAQAILECLDRLNREIAATKGIRVLLEREHDRGLRLMNASGNPVQTRVVAAMEGLIQREVDAGSYVPPIPVPTLAYAIVCVSNAFIYDDAGARVRGDTERLREVIAALLGTAATTRI